MRSDLPPLHAQVCEAREQSDLERETARTGHKLTQREFVLGLIEEALAAERQAEANS